MTKLLVSVRNVSEAFAAVAGGAELIDVKEPSRGALGAADSSVWQAVRAAIGEQCLLSVALGELLEPGLMHQLEGAAVANYAKVGLSQCGSRLGWEQTYHAHLARLPQQVRRVAVIYADYEAADAPRPEAILAAAPHLGCQTILIDTFDKSHGNLLRYLSLRQLASLLDRCHQRQLQLAVAGSLDANLFGQLRNLNFDWLAVRGAACEGGRSGQVVTQRVAELAGLLRTQTATRSDAGWA